jgi:hypothetical protein
MAPSNWLRSLRNTRERYSVRKTRPIRKAALGRKLLLEPLEDRTVPTSITILGSHLRTAAGAPEWLRVLETGASENNGTDITVDAAAGVYHLTTPRGAGYATYGTFTVASDGSIAGTTGALTASGNTIDFDLTKLAAVTVFGTDLQTAAGLQQIVVVETFVQLAHAGPGTDTVYVPAGTFSVTNGLPATGTYGTFTVADNGPGSLVVSGTTGAAVATGNTIHFDETKLAAVTIFGTDLKTAAGLQEQVNVAYVVYLGHSSANVTDTVYVPAGTIGIDNPPSGTYGTFTVADNGSGSLVVTATTGALVATGNTIHFDETKLAAVTVFGTDLKTANGVQERVSASIPLEDSPTDTLYLPAGTDTVGNDTNNYGSFTIGDNGSGSLVVTSTTGALVATGNTIHFDLTKLAAVTLYGNEVNPGGSFHIRIPDALLDGQETYPDTAYFPAGTEGIYTWGPGYLVGTFTVADNGSGSLGVTATTGTVIATDPHTIHFSPPYFQVINTNDSGAGSLRQAILDVNSYAGPNAHICFNIPTTDPGYQSSTGAFIIKPTYALPTLTDAVVIDGYTQPGASPNTLTIGDNAVLKIVLDGSLAGTVDGLVIAGGNSTVRGLVIDNFAPGAIDLYAGLVLNGSGNDIVTGNFIGTDVTGELAAANANGISVDSPDNTIGSPSPADRNIISGNNAAQPVYVSQNGIDLGSNIGSTGTLIEGNYIGTDRSGTSALGNSNGIIGGNYSTIGGVTTTPGTGAGNVISGNTGNGVWLSEGHNLVAGNLIGTIATGTTALGNGNGMLIWSNYNTVGGTTAGARNIISGNNNPFGGGGIAIQNVGNVLAGGSYNLVEGNYIGTDITGAIGLGQQATGIGIAGAYNTIGGTTAAARNVISGNNGTGIGVNSPSNGSFGNVIQGNCIGTDPNGTKVVRNIGYGVALIWGSHDNIIGGTLPGAGNVISGFNGIELRGLPGIGLPCTNNLVQGNLIGTDNTGTFALGNGDGIDIGEADNNTIGGTTAGAGNTIAYSTYNGVYVNAGIGDSILGNSIHDNGGLGILLNTANNANDNQAAPVLTGVSSSSSGTTITGTLASVANTTFRLEFFANPTPANLANTQGQTLLGSIYVTTDAGGNATFSASGLAALPAGQNYLTATATVATPAGSGYTFGDSSQFSPYLHVVYVFGGFRPPLSNNLAFNQNRTIPIKWQLTDLTGALVTSLSAITSLQVAPVLSGGGLGTPFNPTPTANTSLRNDGSQYIFNWDTKGVAVGTYEILLTLADGTLQTKILQIVTKGGSNGLVVNGTSGTTTAVGGLLGGDITLYVDNTNGDLTADELARIQDAVTAADGVTEPYGVAVTEVTDPTLADVTLNMDTTSAVGGYAAGVLGCTTDAGQITIINGWNFYAGSDGTQIGSAQYDFETVVTHELGHALGLGHSTDSTSVMNATLNTGSVNRTLTTADLNVADTDTTGACGLHAAVEVGRVSDPSYQEAGRDLFFAFTGTVDDRLSVPAGSETRAEPSGGVGDPRRTGIDAVFARESQRMIFATASRRDSQDAQFDVPLFPDPDGFDPAEKIGDFIAADSMS